MSELVRGCCAVCGQTDSRALGTTRLLRGEVVVVCGTHELMHARMPRRAETTLELRAALRERRHVGRRHPIADELADRLTAAFSGPDRRGRERRTG